MALPNFLGIGAPRCGTTALYYCLRDHPQIFLCGKEQNYFLQDHAGNLPPWVTAEDAARVPFMLSDYEALFSGAGPQHRAIGEFSPSYMSAAAATRIQRALPSVKVIATLRHPVDQARSILATWLERPPKEVELRNWLADKRGHGPYAHPPLVTHGRYIDHLRAYFRLFDRDRQIKVVLFEDLVRDPQMVLGGIQDFLGVDRYPLQLRHFNAAGRSRSKLVEKALGPRAKHLARALLPESAVRWLLPRFHKIRARNTIVEEPLDPTIRHWLFEKYYLGTTQQLSLLLPRGMLRPWLGDAEFKTRIVA